MFPDKTAALIPRIVEAWSRHSKQSPAELQIMIEKDLWLGEFPRHRHRRFGWWRMGVDWYVNLPDGYPPGWIDDDLVKAQTYESIAFHWPRPVDRDMIAEDNPSPLVDVVLTRDEFHEWLSAQGHDWPGFWGPRASYGGDAASPAPPNRAQGKRRGPSPALRTRIANAMRADIVNRKFTAEQLDGMGGEALAAEYGTKRGTAVEARKEVLAEFQTSTNSDQ
jgi:hypothetical protein